MSRRRSNLIQMRRPARRRRTSRRPAGALLLALVLLLVVGALAWPRIIPAIGEPEAGEWARVELVVDGDTFVIATGERVRVLNIDTAELSPRAACAGEADLALRAQTRLRQLLTGRDVELIRRGPDVDRYGRSLRLVRLDDRDIGVLLVQEGLAQTWRGRKAEWC